MPPVLCEAAFAVHARQLLLAVHDLSQLALVELIELRFSEPGFIPLIQ